MKVAGSFEFGASRERVFAAICDPATLMAVIPGCQGIEQTSADTYRGRIALRLPGFAGAYDTTVRLVDAVPPERAGMDGAVEGRLGSIRGRADFVLDERLGGSLLTYEGDATISGPLARLDSRFAAGLAQSLITQGLRTLDQRLVASGNGRRETPIAAAADPRPAHTEASE